MIDRYASDITAAQCRQASEQEIELFIPETDDIMLLLNDYQKALDNRAREREWDPDFEHDQELSRQLASRAQTLGFSIESRYRNHDILGID